MPDPSAEALEREHRAAGRHGRVRGEPREEQHHGGDTQQGKGTQPLETKVRYY